MRAADPDPVPENCHVLAQHIIEKKDWSKDAIGDIQSIVRTDLASIFDAVKKHVTNLETEYISLVERDANVTADTKTQLEAYIKKLVNESIPGVDQMAETSYNLFATSNSRDVELLNGNSNLFVSLEKLNEHIEKLRDYITKGCLNIIRNIKTAEFEPERAIQNQLIRNNVNVPTYIYAFHPSPLVPLVDELDDSEHQLINENKVKEAVVAIAVLAADLLDGIVEDIDTDVSNAHKAIEVNINGSSKLTADEKTAKLKSVQDFVTQYKDSIRDVKARISVFVASKRAAVPENLRRFVDKVDEEALPLSREINQFGEKFFNDIGPLTSSL